MPDYVYTCGEHTANVSHRMLYTTAVMCETCGEEMWRVPQPQRVNWNGLPPHKETHPRLQRFIDDTPRRRERTEAKYADRTEDD